MELLGARGREFGLGYKDLAEARLASLAIDLFYSKMGITPGPAPPP